MAFITPLMTWVSNEYIFYSSNGEFISIGTKYMHKTYTTKDLGQFENDFWHKSFG